METDAAIGREFFPRPQITDVLSKRLSAFKNDYRQNICLIGRKFLGKSSILKNFLLTTDTSGIIPIYLEVGFDPIERFLHKWMGALLYGILRSRTDEVPRAPKEVIRRVKAAAPRTLRLMRTIRAALRRGERVSAFEMTAALTGEASVDLGKKVLLIVDEFHRIDQFGIKRIHEIFGKAIMLQKDTMFVMASSAPETARHILSEQLALLFGNFEVVETTPLNFSECHDFIQHRLGRSDLKRSLERFLLRITDGNPYYLDVLIQRIRHLGKEQWLWRLNESIFVEAITEELFFRSGLLHLRFMNLLELINKGKGNPHLISVLVSLASGNKKVREIAHRLRQKPSEVKKCLSRLLEEGMLTQDYSMFTISDSLFSFWLKEVYSLREMHFDLNSGYLADLFRSRLHHLVRASEEADSKEIPERIVKLFERFHDDVVLLDGKRFRCSRFTTLRSKPSNGRVFPVLGETDRGAWMAQVAYDRLREEDVQQFVKDEQSLPKRLAERIMIALNGSDLNAKLMAKEHGLILWSLRDLNHLLKLYDQPKVII